MSADTRPGLRQRFFDQVLRYEPEEATTLGVEASRGRWKDWSPAAVAGEVAFYEDVLDSLDGVEPATDDERADHASMRRFSRWKVHAWRDLELHLGNVEASVLPVAVVHFQRAHGWDAAERLAAMPALQQQLEANWRIAIARGRLPDAGVLEEIACRDLPEAAAFFGAHDPRAGEAWARHAEFLQTEALPRAVDRPSIGEDEYRWRLEHMLGVPDTPAELIERAHTHLAEIQSLIVQLAGAMSPSAIHDLAGARAFVAEVQAPRLDDPMAGYGSILECAVGFVLDEGLFHVPDDFALELLAATPGLPTPANWPAPLLVPGARGHFVVQTGAVHSRAWAADVAIHDGIPGHSLQSAVWQRVFEDDPAPVRCLHLADFVAAAHQYWAPMLNVEGWAVYAEELMRRSGFFADAEEELCVFVSHAIRWARVVVDASLHTGRMDTARAERFLAEQTCIPDALAAAEVRRYKRIPLQAITYALGWQRIEALAEASPLAPADFHAELLRLGPVFPPDQTTP